MHLCIFLYSADIQPLPARAKSSAIGRLLPSAPSEWSSAGEMQGGGLGTDRVPPSFRDRQLMDTMRQSVPRRLSYRNCFTETNRTRLITEPSRLLVWRSQLRSVSLVVQTKPRPLSTRKRYDTGPTLHESTPCGLDMIGKMRAPTISLLPPLVRPSPRARCRQRLPQQEPQGISARQGFARISDPSPVVLQAPTWSYDTLA